ncbi:uncharacterized protein LOC121872982 [Homarus americanus]|nr:uncharacterized protein LOC121872982 [Homarus americanus]
MAESLLTISAEDFTKKWNFDPIMGVPLHSGRFNWTPTDPEGGAAGGDQRQNDLNTCLTLPVNDLSVSLSGVSDLHRCPGNICPHTPVGAGGGASRCRHLPPDLPRSQLPTENDKQTTEENCQRSEDNSQQDKQTAEEDKQLRVKDSPGAADAQTGGDNSQHVNSQTAQGDSQGQPAESDRQTVGVEVEGEGDAAVEEEVPSPPPHTSRLRQTSITDYVRPQKTLAASSSPLAGETHHHHHTQLTKKRPAPSSLQDHLHQPPHKKVLLQLRA